MKKRTGTVILAVIMLTVGGIVGFVAGSKSANAAWTASFRGLVVACASKETATYTQVLKALRSDKEDLAVNRLEILLDHSVIQLGREYSPEYDMGGWAGKSLTLARDYRAAFPHKSSSQNTDEQVKAAFATKIVNLENR